jgi:hypothetical protein
MAKPSPVSTLANIHGVWSLVEVGRRITTVRRVSSHRLARFMGIADYHLIARWSMLFDANLAFEGRNKPYRVQEF